MGSTDGSISNREVDMPVDDALNWKRKGFSGWAASASFLFFVFSTEKVAETSAPMEKGGNEGRLGAGSHSSSGDAGGSEFGGVQSALHQPENKSGELGVEGPSLTICVGVGWLFSRPFGRGTKKKDVTAKRRLIECLRMSFRRASPFGPGERAKKKSGRNKETKI